MFTTQRADHALRPHAVSTALPPVREPEIVEESPTRGSRDATAEVNRLRCQIERLVRVDADGRARDAVDAALATVARLQVVNANLDACRPLSEHELGSAVLALADRRLSGHADAIERG